MNPDDFWRYLERLVAESRVIIDRPKGSHHPHYPDIVYPLDYGYLVGTTSGDGSGIDVWTGASGTRDLSVVILTVDLHKRDAEIKILLGCSEDEIQTILEFYNENDMRATLVHKPKE
ncbi:MAG: inorganic pyrophosphatase [Candidatus Atribacteria bacterium]|nr:inorganic pyrophosphatase [Candidatus Atribacteria bacterium]